MIKKIFISLLFLSLTLVTYEVSLGWGVWGHQHINRAAVFALPQSMRGFYFNHIDFITIEASIPDVRKYAIHDTREFPRHYIDLETFGDHPFDVLPQTWDAAIKKYGKKKLLKAGILPWYIQEILGKLTTAFRRQNKVSILFLSADLAHYIGDAYMPLHTALNYDGQLTGQRGVHSLWESLLPKLFGKNFNLHTPTATYLKDPVKATWDILRESHGQVHALLATEKHLLDTWPKDKIYKTDSSGKTEKNKLHQREFSYAFAKAYYHALNGMVEKQMRLAITKVADYWYTAWVNAGKPNLHILDDPYTDKINKKQLRKQYRLWVRKGKLTGIKSSPEY